MDNLYLLRELVAVYGSTTVVSLIFNYFYHVRRANKAFKESKRELVYKHLSTESYLSLSSVRTSKKLSNIIAMVLATVPVVQVFYTISNINADPNYLRRYYESKIEEINNLEVDIRKELLKRIKNAKSIPEPIEEKLKNEEYLPTEEDYRDVLNHNCANEYAKVKSVHLMRKKD